MAKKNEYIMTIGFNRNDPQHQDAVKILNAMNRTKGQYIVKAILAYENMQMNGKGMGFNEIDYGKLRSYVLQIIEEHEKTGIITGHQDLEETVQVEIPVKAEAGSKGTGIGEEAWNGIMSSLNSFRNG